MKTPSPQEAAKWASRKARGLRGDWNILYGEDCVVPAEAIERALLEADKNGYERGRKDRQAQLSDPYLVLEDEALLRELMATGSAIRKYHASRDPEVAELKAEVEQLRGALGEWKADFASVKTELSAEREAARRLVEAATRVVKEPEGGWGIGIDPIADLEKALKFYGAPAIPRRGKAQ